MSKKYFTEKHQEAILEFVASPNEHRREFLYRSTIEPALDEMIKRIVFTYKFNNLPNIEDLKNDCKVYIVTKFDKFNPGLGSMAFAYFSVCIRNWFSGERKKHQKRLRREKEFNNHIMQNSEAESKNSPEDTAIAIEQFVWFKRELYKWKKYTTLKPQERVVLNAVIVLAENIDKIENFSKKAIRTVYLQDITKLNSKQIANNLKKLTGRYRKFKKKWDNGEI